MIMLALYSQTSHADEAESIIADHTVVDQYDKIPKRWMDEVKKMRLNVPGPGESHSSGYRIGVQSFQRIHSDNMLNLDGFYAEDGDHIGERGAVRLAKAMWWLLARLAGWDGKPELPSGAIFLLLY